MKENRPPIYPFNVDDNKVEIVLLVPTFENWRHYCCRQECNDAIEAKARIYRNNAIDILFLDVEMPGISGIELLKLIPQREKTTPILTTAKKGYAVEAFELNVVLPGKTFYLNQIDGINWPCQRIARS